MNILYWIRTKFQCPLCAEKTRTIMLLERLLAEERLTLNRLNLRVQRQAGLIKQKQVPQSSNVQPIHGKRLTVSALRDRLERRDRRIASKSPSLPHEELTKIIKEQEQSVGIAHDKE